MKDFSNILCSILRQRDMTQKMLAEKAHTTEATISRYLSDTKRMPRADLVVSIAEALDVSTDYLLGLSPIASKQALSSEMEKLLSCYSKSSENDRKVIWAVLDKYQADDFKIAASGQDQWNSSDSPARQAAIKKFEDE